MSNSLGTFLLCHLNQTLGNQRTGEGSAQQILALINSPSLQGWPYVLLQELLSQIQNIALGSAGTQSLVMDSLHVIPLADISTAGNNLAAAIVFLEPRNDNGGIKTTGICQYDFLKFCHNIYNSLIIIST